MEDVRRHYNAYKADKDVVSLFALEFLEKSYDPKDRMRMADMWEQFCKFHEFSQRRPMYDIDVVDDNPYEYREPPPPTAKMVAAKMKDVRRRLRAFVPASPKGVFHNVRWAHADDHKGRFGDYLERATGLTFLPDHSPDWLQDPATGERASVDYFASVDTAALTEAEPPTSAPRSALAVDYVLDGQPPPWKHAVCAANGVRLITMRFPDCRWDFDDDVRTCVDKLLGASA